MRRIALPIVAIATLALTGCQSVSDPRSAMTVDDVIAAFEAQPGLPVTDPVELSVDECDPDTGCTTAVRADEIAIYRFDSTAGAATFATTLGSDGYQSDWIVLEYPDAGADTEQSKLSYAGIVDGMWTSD
jgi:hypothetical protein